MLPKNIHKLKLNSTGMEIKGEIHFVHAHAMHIQNTSPMDSLNAVKSQKYFHF